MSMLRRHQLAYLNRDGWRELLRRPWGADAGGFLSWWRDRGLPLVVTRQSDSGDTRLPRAIALGIAAPPGLLGRRIALSVPPGSVDRYGEFPALGSFEAGDFGVAPGALLALQCLVDDLGAPARVYGSHGWQFLSGLKYVRSTSDLDLLLPVRRADDADHLARGLARMERWNGPQLDGELVFPDGAGFAWREWLRWRSGECRAILRKTIDHIELLPAPQACRPGAARI